MDWPPIKYFIVLMLENRSFDHMLGFLKSPDIPSNGWTARSRKQR